MIEKKLKILHICSDYAKQRLYSELVVSLAKNDIEQFVYVPIRSKEEINYNLVNRYKNIQFLYSNILRKHHRLFFRLKAANIFNDLQNHIDVQQYAITHAHFLYSDGIVARKIHKKFNIPYIIAVRNTDINVFMKFRLDLRWVCWDILRNASKIVFITPSYYKKLSELVPPDIQSLLENKFKVIPNGLNEFWLKNRILIESVIECPLRLLYVGDFSPNKNIIGIIKAAKILNDESPTLLTLVGAGKDHEKIIDDMLIDSKYQFVTRVGQVSNKEHLRDIYTSHDIFLMPSFFETFGLSYIEALSQGLPVVHARGQGIDGYFTPGSVAAAVDPSNPESIAEGVRVLAKRLPAIKILCVQESKKFNWSLIAKSYKEVYCQIVHQPI